MSEWKEYKLGEVYDFSSGLSKPREFFGKGFGFVSFKDVFYNYFLPEQLTELVMSTDKEQISCSVKKGDVFLTRTSETMEELGMSTVALKDYPLATFNGFTKRLRPKDPSLISPKFAGYYFRSPLFRATVSSYAIMTTRASLNNEILGRLTISLPDFKTQESIGEVLKSLDDKIELNNKINQELEALAQTLFKQWFIDFEFPNENGEPYKSSGGEMVESELGEIPKGWVVKPYSEIADIKLGGTPSSMKPEYWDGEIPWVNSGGINKNYIIKGVKGISELGLKKSATKLIRENSTLIAITGATLGQVSYSFIEACYNQSVVSLTTDKLINEYVHQYVLFFIADLTSHQTGGAQQHINKGDVENSSMLLPLNGILENFKSIIYSLYRKIELNLKELEYLTNLRDTLLPKLISGELEINEIRN